MGKYCHFDDGHKSIARVYSDDGKEHTSICVLHLMQFLSPNQTSKDGGILLSQIVLKRGYIMPKLPKQDEIHEWDRMYLVGTRGPWQCKKCGLTVNAGMWSPPETAFGGCVGDKSVNWEEMGVVVKDVREY